MVYFMIAQVHLKILSRAAQYLSLLTIDWFKWYLINEAKEVNFCVFAVQYLPSYEVYFMITEKFLFLLD